MKHIARWLLVAALAFIPVEIAGAQTIPGGGGGTPAPCTAFGTTAGTCLQGAGALGTPSSGTGTNLTGIPLTSGVTGTLPLANGGTGVTSAQGNGTKVQLSTGSATTNDCVKFDANGNTVSSGAACGTGSGSVTSVATGACLTGGPITTTGTVAGTYSIRAVTGTTDTILAADACGLVTYSNGSAVAVTLPAPSGSFASGFGFDGQNLGAGTVTITPGGGALINGSASLAIAQNRGCSIASDGTNYQVSACTALVVAGAGTVTSVALSAPSNVACVVSGSPVTTTGTLTCTPAGTSGGVPYFSSSSALSSSGALTANLPVIGGGAGAAPAVGTRSGNTTAYVTTTGSQTSGDVVSIDASGNHIASGTALTNLVTTNTAQTITASKRGTVQTLSPSASTYTPNFDTGNNFTLTLAATNTIANPSTTPVAGQSGIFEIIQDGTGGRLVTWGSQYVATGGVSTLTLSTAISAKDYLSYYVVDATHILLSVGALNATH